MTLADVRYHATQDLYELLFKFGHSSYRIILPYGYIPVKQSSLDSNYCVNWNLMYLNQVRMVLVENYTTPFDVEKVINKEEEEVQPDFVVEAS